jgi:putative restriction endonuclease
MRAYIGVTDSRWFEFLRDAPRPLDEVNFWQPSGHNRFGAINPGELFLFKLHYPQNYIVGGGIFAGWSRLPIRMAWDSFDIANGAGTFFELCELISHHRRQSFSETLQANIGCIMLEQPFFLSKEEWIPAPADWSPNLVRGKVYDLSIEPGLSVWKSLHFGFDASSRVREEQARFGEPTFVFPRLGQGSFRVMVTDAYSRCCAITHEKTLPALDAAHIIPYSQHGEHAITNGILLRRDLHALFDQGYLTITPSLIVEVSRKIKEEFENGRDYYKLHGGSVQLPSKNEFHPSKLSLQWHNEKIYRG